MDEIEAVARAIDPDAWADDVPIPTRGHVLDFHERRQRSCQAARAAIATLDECRRPLNFVGNVVYRKGEPIDPADWNPDEGSGVFWPAPKRWFPSFNPNDPSTRAVYDAYRAGREAGLREAAGAFVNVPSNEWIIRGILTLIDAKERHSANE